MRDKGTIIGHTYIIKEVLGKGSSGNVFLAGKINEKELYTLKISENVELLRQEAIICREIQSEYFPRYVDFFREENCGCLILEYLEGTSLQHMLDKGRVFSEREIFIIMESLTAALAKLHYHKSPMVHLDIKPSNILITTRGNVRIIDMGVARFQGVKKSLRGGTYGYGAPEQFWQGFLPGPEADVYACGKLMAYLFTGKNPSQPPYDVERHMLRSSGVKSCWQRIILKCLELEPGRRYPDANILHTELMKLENQRGNRGIAFRKREGDVVYLKSIWKSDYERL